MGGRASLVAWAVVTAVNAAMLLGVAGDRSADLRSQVWLDERELRLDPDRENSAATLRWRVQQVPGRGTLLDDAAPAWLDAQALSSLGFDCSMQPGDPRAPQFYDRQLPRRALVVFDVETVNRDRRLALWQERARDRLERSTQPFDASARKTLQATVDDVAARASRLVPADAGLDAAALEARYTDRRRYLIVPAVLRVVYHRGVGAGGPSICGRIVELLPAAIQVPSRLTGVFAGLEQDPAGLKARRFSGGDVLAGLTLIEHRPRYRVKVGFSAMGRPKIEDAERLP